MEGYLSFSTLALRVFTTSRHNPTHAVAHNAILRTLQPHPHDFATRLPLAFFFGVSEMVSPANSSVSRVTRVSSSVTECIPGGSDCLSLSALSESLSTRV